MLRSEKGQERQKGNAKHPYDGSGREGLVRGNVSKDEHQCCPHIEEMLSRDDFGYPKVVVRQIEIVVIEEEERSD